MRKEAWLNGKAPASKVGGLKGSASSSLAASSKRKASKASAGSNPAASARWSQVIQFATMADRLASDNLRIMMARVVIVEGIITKANVQGGERGVDIGGAFYVWGEKEKH